MPGNQDERIAPGAFPEADSVRGVSMTGAESSVALSAIAGLAFWLNTGGGAGLRNCGKSGTAAVQRGNIGIANTAANIATIALERTSRRTSADFFLGRPLTHKAAPSATRDFQKPR